MAHDQDHHDHGPKHYLKIYALLLLLFVISVIGPEIGIRWVTLVTAFGIAIVKFLMVAAYFMHLNIEKRYIHWMLYSMLIFVGLFFTGVMVDIMGVRGHNWENLGAIENMKKYEYKLDHSADH